MTATPPRPRSTLLALLPLWFCFYCSFTLFTPPLLDDADSVHAEVAREMLLRHDYVTLYANGIRYLEKAPLLYWSMAGSMRVSQLLGRTSPGALAAAARLPLALAVLALAWLCEAFARRVSRTASAGLYAGLIALSSFGLFIYSHLTLPDVLVCVWLLLSLYSFWQTEQPANEQPGSEQPEQTGQPGMRTRRWCFLFAVACALNVLTKGLIGVVFPLGIVFVYLLITRGWRSAFSRLRSLHPVASTLCFLLVAAPWHIAAGLANPTQGHPAPFHFVAGHWQVPLPSDGNVRGWFWFYFMNEHVLRYLNLRVPRDYDTVPLLLFWGLCFVWLVPWSAFAPSALRAAVPTWTWTATGRSQRHTGTLSTPARAKLLLAVASIFVLLFFSLSTRQEYYVLPALPALAILIACFLAERSRSKPPAENGKRPGSFLTAFFLVAGIAYALVAFSLYLHAPRPAVGTQLSDLLTQNPGEYALSMGHFLDLKTRALGLFHPSLLLSGFAALLAPLTYGLLRRRGRMHAAHLLLAAGTFVFLLAADLALITFAPTLSSAQLARAVAPQLRPEDLLVIHGEYEAGSTLGFYLKRTDIHILEGRSSNLWYGSFFPDAPKIFESRESMAAKWLGTQRVFLWEDTHDAERASFLAPSPVYLIAQSEGKRILSNRPNR